MLSAPPTNSSDAGCSKNSKFVNDSHPRVGVTNTIPDEDHINRPQASSEATLFHYSELLRQFSIVKKLTTPALDSTDSDSNHSPRNPELLCSFQITTQRWNF